jgi:outer membrane receptor protein involved in Fe transport
MEGALQLNVSAYTNDYEGLQLSQIVNRASINQNADAKIDGIEAEFTLLLSDTLVIDGFVSKTSTRLKSSNLLIRLIRIKLLQSFLCQLEPLGSSLTLHL